MNPVQSIVSDLTPSEIPRTYRELFKEINLSPYERRDLERLRVWRPIADFTMTLMLMGVAPFAFTVMPGFLAAVLCLALALHNFNRLASMVHASDHGYLFENPTANNSVGNFCAYIMGYTRTGHRLAHQTHHSYLNTERDSDKVWGEPSDNLLRIIRKWMEDLFFVSALRRILQYSQSERSSFTASPWKRLNPEFVKRALVLQAPMVPVQVALFGYYWLVAGPYYYFLLHLLPLFTVYPALIRLRSTVEHSFPPNYVPADTEQRWIARTTDANWLERFIIAPLDGHYHFEHHLLPAVPYYNLAKAHAMISSKGFPVPLAPGYFSFISSKWRQEREIAAART